MPGALAVPGSGVGNPLLCTCLLKQGLLVLCMQYGSSPPWLKHIQICISNLSLQSEQYSLLVNISLQLIISIDNLKEQQMSCS